MNRTLRTEATMFSLMTIVAVFFIGPVMALAAPITNDQVANYSSIWNLSRFGGLHWTDDAVYMKKADGEPAFCIEHGVDL